MSKKGLAAFVVAFTALARIASASPGPAGTIAHGVWALEDCSSCHAQEESASIAARVSRPCRTLCARCHEFRERHHAVGVPIPARASTRLLLTRAGTITCSTCHDTSRPRTESAPWVSQSLFDRVARRSGENRTHYLAMRNDKGQLCRNCH